MAADYRTIGERASDRGGEVPVSRTSDSGIAADGRLRRSRSGLSASPEASYRLVTE
jgi:hypothetical protein